MNFKARSRRRVSSLGSLPLTSMIDIVFLLLIYFLVTSSFTQPEKELASALSAEGSGASVTDLSPQVIDIVLGDDGAVAYHLGSRVILSRSELGSVLSALPKEPGVAVRARADVPIGAIAGVMQIARDTGFSRRSYVPRTSP